MRPYMTITLIKFKSLVIILTRPLKMLWAIMYPIMAKWIEFATIRTKTWIKPGIFIARKKPSINFLMKLYT